ncbi:DM13 domain-containing protein [Mycobacterium sp. IDR2000157661]|uniref:DM13 domain-containing protein n=1 Tax=Mycobacterium sp. IDR2000157661 TaxID=2867005 RepID=UPI001EEBCF6D|nr:DM13 domain-containing protein [Mycobacterium sp. IDR2000157661]ULE34556.1 DM13 domain-containing protein [Mycobacterium sp. IDR2000157661]
MATILKFLRRPVVLAVVGLLVVAAAVGAYWFQPWKAFTDTTVDEPLPTVAAAPSAEPTTGAPTVVGEGTFVGHEHATTGVAKLLRLPDGSHVVRVENLDTSDGPDLIVLLADAPVVDGPDGGKAFTAGRYVNLGKLKGNRGSANYPVPADVDVTGLTSVGIWCDRFDVSFGAAPLAGPGSAADRSAGQ